MTTYFSWLPTMNFGTYVGYSGDNKQTFPNTPENLSSIPNERNGMFGFWGDIFGKTPKFEKYSNENLKRLSDLLEKKSKYGNDESMVEILKEMTQILIWGDQHKHQPILDYFFEKNMHDVILNTLKRSKSPYVTKQILQSMNILYENIHDLTSLYYLLSNNYVNEIICHKYDFSNDEILAYYIYFLRTLSFKLDRNILSSFFNERHDDFPLYSEAIKFFNSDESMIRAAVRTVTLNIFAINDKHMQEFVLDRNVSPYFSNLVNFIAEFSTTLDEISSLSDYEKHYQRFNYYLAEHCDNFYYINDIIGLKNEKMNQELTSHLMDLLLKPIYADSLVQRTLLPSRQSVRVDSVVALTLLCHVLHIFRHPQLVTAVVAMLFSNSPELMDYPHSPRLNSSYANPSTLFKSKNLYREAIMGFLMPEIPENLDDHDYLDLNTLPALCLIYMSCRNHAISPDVLLATEVYPRKLLKTRRLKDTLSSYSEDLSSEPPFSFSQARLLDSASMDLTGSSTLQHKPSYANSLYNESLLSSIFNKGDHGLFADFMNEIPYGSSPIPSVKITGESSRPQARNYRAVLIQKIITLLCVYYRLCRPITLQMATELLLELLYYNGSGECLTPEQTETMNNTEEELQRRVKNYFLEGREFQLEELEKAVNESMFGGDKYVREIIMNAKLLFPPPLSIPPPAISADPSKKNEARSTITNEIIRDIKTLHLLRQSRLLLSKESIPEESASAKEEEYIEEEDDCKEELAYHNELVDEKFVQAHQQMYSTSKNSNNKVHKRSDTKDSLVKISEYDKRKKSVLDKLGIQL